MSAVGSLSPAQLDELVDGVSSALETIIVLLHDAAEKAGHHPGNRPPEWGPGLEPCVICHEPWPCKPMIKVLKATHGITKALMALGAAEEVIGSVGPRHRPRAAV